MKTTYFLLLCVLNVPDALICMNSSNVICDEKGKLFGDMQKGPMNPDWFYSGVLPYCKANQLHQSRKWQEAVQGYRNIKNETLIQHIPHQESQSIIYKPTQQEIDYSKHMCLLNEAICSMAQRLPHKGWTSFDVLINIPEEKRISKEIISSGKLRDALITVRTDTIGIGDIFHYMYAASLLKESAGCHIVFSIRDRLKDALSGFEVACNVSLMGEGEKQIPTNFEIHLMSLLGLLELRPHQVVPPRVLLTAPERAMVAVAQQINPILALGKMIAAVFLGENRQATLIGGKLLNNRHLDSEAFKTLLRKDQQLLLMDCGTKDSRVKVDENQKNQYMQLVPEKKSFDTIKALALFMNIHRKMIAFGADNGPYNLFARALDLQAQKRAVFIIPNGSKDHGEYDMRMEGEGLSYKHMLYDNCMVYKCENPLQQTEVINKAYDDMNKIDVSPDMDAFIISQK